VLFTDQAPWWQPSPTIVPDEARMTKTVAKAMAVVMMMSFVAACATKPAPSPAPIVRKG
jgi:hypothetical protein